LLEIIRAKVQAEFKQISINIQAYFKQNNSTLTNFKGIIEAEL